MMSDHIPREELSALLDDGPGAHLDVADHLERCPACERELELMRRMRMALSALDDLEAPAGQWGRIQGALRRRGSVAGGGAGAETATGESVEAHPHSAPGGEAGDRGGTGWFAWSDFLPQAGGEWLRAAAAVLLFAGGIALGSAVGGGAGSSASGPDVAASGPAGGDDGAPGRVVAADDSGARDAGTVSALQQLEALRSRGPDPEEAYRNPRAAAERLARLDALIRATREALEEDPTDPVVNDLLFEAVEERQQLNQALHLASLDYR